MFNNPFCQEKTSTDSNERQQLHQLEFESKDEGDFLSDITDESHNMSDNKISQFEAFSNPFMNKDNRVSLMSKIFSYTFRDLKKLRIKKKKL